MEVEKIEESQDLRLVVDICKNELVQKDLDGNLDKIEEELSVYDDHLDMYLPEIDESNVELMAPEVAEVLQLKDLDENIRKYQDLRKLCCNLLYISRIIPIPTPKPTENEEKPDKQDKRIESCTDSIVAAVEKAGLSKSEFEEIIEEKIKAGQLIPIINFTNDDITPLILLPEEGKEYDLAKYLFKQTPYDFSGTYARAGVGEFMFCVLHPEIEKPTDYGDLIINGKRIELKGKEFEINGRITSQIFLEKMKNLSSTNPTKDKIDKLNEEYQAKARQLRLDLDLEADTNKSHKEAINALFNEMGFDESKKLIKNWLKQLGVPDEFQSDVFIDEIIKKGKAEEEKELIIFDSNRLRRLTALSFLNDYFNVAGKQFDVFIRLGKEGDKNEIYKIRKEQFEDIPKLLDPDCKILKINTTGFGTKDSKIGFKFQ